MRRKGHIILFICLLLSCKETYVPEIDTDLNVLTVDGLITDSIGLNYIKLGTASPYDFNDTLIYGTVQYHASVYLTDNEGSTIPFYEKLPGYYVPEDSLFCGSPGRIYILNIKTNDGNYYISKSQKLLPNIEPDSTYLKKDVKDDVYTDGFGSTHLVVKDINKICYDFRKNDDDVMRFRFKTKEYIDYIIVKPPFPPDPFYQYYYCWYAINNDDGLIFTNEKFALTTSEIIGFPVEWFYRISSIMIPDMNQINRTYDTVYVKRRDFARIIRIDQFRINNETYEYYKGIAKQNSDQGKIFDPISTQLYGNLKCINDSAKLVLGFFEASSVSTDTYGISGYSLDSLRRLRNFTPPLKDRGFYLNIRPDFWFLFGSFE